MARSNGHEVAAWSGGTTFKTNQAGRFPTYSKGTVNDDFQAVAASGSAGRYIAVGDAGLISESGDGKKRTVRRMSESLEPLLTGQGDTEVLNAYGHNASAALMSSIALETSLVRPTRWIPSLQWGVTADEGGGFLAAPAKVDGSSIACL